MQQAKWRAHVGVSLVLTVALAGCHGRPAPPPSAYPGGITQAQMEQGIAQVNSDPTLTPDQKTQKINLIRSHIKITSPPTGGSQ